MTTDAARVPSSLAPSQPSCPGSPLFIPSVDNPRIAQPVILTAFDSLPSPMASTPRTNCDSPTSLYLSVPEEQEQYSGDKRKRDDIDEFSVSNKFTSSIDYGSSQDGETSDDSSSYSRRPGRKQMSDGDETVFEVETDDPKVKRKVQNRAAQRAFRERKERYVKELESKIKQAQDNHVQATAQLVQENQHLRSIVYRLEAENFALKGIHIQFPIHPSPYTGFSPAIHPPPATHPGPLSTPPSERSRDVQYTFAISTPATLRPKILRNDHEQEAQFTRILQEQVSNDAIERLLSEPLFDTSGGLIAPAVTGESEEEASNKLLNCPDIWQRLCKHSRFSYFTMEELCLQVRHRAKCTEQGPALAEADMEEILGFMDKENHE